MKYFSIKTLLFPLLGLCALFLFACLEPIGIDVILEDDITQEYLFHNRVKLVDNSNDGLYAGNTKIFGLNSNKYYVVQEKNTGGVASLRYVTSSGALGGSPAQISKVVTVNPDTGNPEITGLDNYHNYTTWSAVPIQSNMRYWHQMTPPAPGAPESGTLTSNSSGVIIEVLDAPAQFYYLDLTVPLESSYSNYIVLKVPSGGGPAEEVSSLMSTNILRLDKTPNSSFDYLFISRDAAGTDVTSFRFLRVNIDKVPEFRVTVVDLTLVDLAPTPSAVLGLNYSELSSYGGTTGQRQITINNANDFSSISWYYNDDELISALTHSGNIFTLDFDDDETYNSGLNAAGTHVITIIAVHGGANYSATIRVTVNDDLELNN